MLPPQGSVTTGLISGTGVSGGNKTEAEAGHQGMADQHAMGEAAGHQHDSPTEKHDHGAKASPKGMGHQHGPSTAADHKHDDAAGKHDHGSKNVAPPKGKPSQPLPTDLMGSAGTGPGKTIPSPGGQPKPADKSSGAHDHGSKQAPQAPAKASQHNHSSHSHAGGAEHDHGATGVSPGKEKVEKMKAKDSAATHQHGPSEPAGHSHAGGSGHAHGTEMQAKQVINPIKATEASVKTGHKLFSIYCAVCHGSEGRGGAPMAGKLAGIPKFTAELLRSVDDAHMFSMVTSGHGPMPGYAEALSPEERWHVANYVNTLQKKLANEQQSSPRGASR